MLPSQPAAGRPCMGLQSYCGEIFIWPCASATSTCHRSMIAGQKHTCTKAGLSASMADTISADVDRTVSRTPTRLPATLTVRFGGTMRPCARTRNRCQVACRQRHPDGRSRPRQIASDEKRHKGRPSDASRTQHVMRRPPPRPADPKSRRPGSGPPRAACALCPAPSAAPWVLPPRRAAAGQ